MRPRVVPRSVTLPLLAAALAVIGACSSDDAVAPSTTVEPVATTTTFVAPNHAAPPVDSSTTTTTDVAERPVATTPGPTWARLGGHEEVFEWRSYRAMDAVAAGGPGLVAVGQDFQGVDRVAAVWTSSDGLEWTRVPFDVEVFGGSQVAMNAVVAGGPGLVAVGNAFYGIVGGAAVWTSTDGLDWARVPLDDEVLDGGAMEAVAVGGPGLVAVGGAVWASTDGFEWTLMYLPVDTTDGSAAASMNSVVAHDSGLVAVGWAFDAGADSAVAAVWTSPDGFDWSRVPHDDEVFGGDTAMINAVALGGPGLVAVGEATGARGSVAAVWTSVDGHAWSRVPHDAELFGGRSRDQLDCDDAHPGVDVSDFADHHSLRSVALGDSGLAALGSALECDGQVAAVWTSTDGRTWSRVPHDEGVFGGVEPPELRSVAPWASGFVAVGAANLDATGNADAAVWISPPPQPSDATVTQG